MFDITQIPEPLIDAFKDSFATLPFLFGVFMFIELSENYFFRKIKNLSGTSKILGPFFGAASVAVPQCGIPVIAATLYSQGFLSKGTLVSVFIAASDEAVPLFFAFPDKISMLFPILFFKFSAAFFAGIIVNLFSNKGAVPDKEQLENDIENSEGCCHEKVISKKNIFIHPLKHTVGVFVFIFIITLGLNYLTAYSEDFLNALLMKDLPILQITTASFIGLIPNCAVSLLLTMLYIKGSLSLPAVTAGLCSSAGLGLLVLLKKNKPFKDNLNILFCLISTALLTGFIIYFLEIILYKNLF